MDESALYGIGTFVVAKTLLHCLSIVEGFVYGGAPVIDTIRRIIIILLELSDALLPIVS